MIIEPQPDLDGSLSRRFGTVAEEAQVKRTAAALEANGIEVLRAADAAEAKRIVLGLIPDGSQVHHGASESLEASGITDEIEKSGRYEFLRPRIWSMDRTTQADEIRRLSSTPDVMLGSVHAVTETGSLIAASMSGSQLGPYVSGAGRVSSSWGRRRSCPTSRRAFAASTSTPSRSKMPAPRRRTAFTAQSTRSSSSTARSPRAASPSSSSTRSSGSNTAKGNTS